MSTEGTNTAPTNNGSQLDTQDIKPKKSRKWLSAAFNMAVGAGISATVKSCAFGLMACTAAPSLATVLVPAAAGGIALSLHAMHKDYRAAKKAGEDSPTFWSWKKFFSHTATALAGGAIVGFWGDEIKNGLMGLFNSPDTAAPTAQVTPPMVNEPAAVEPSSGSEAQDTPLAKDDLAPTPEPVSAAEEIQEPAENTEAETEQAPEKEVESAVENAPEPYVPTETLEKAVSYLQNNADTPQNILDRVDEAMNGDPQAQKDIADHLFNDCYPEDGQKNTAALLAKEAAEAGNIQAQEFWSYVRYWGLAGIESNKTEALAAMREINTASAQHLAAQWGGDIPMEQVEDVNCDKDTNAGKAAVAEDFNEEAKQEKLTSEPSPDPAEINNQPVQNSAAAEQQQSTSDSPSNKEGCTAIIDIEEGVSFLCTIDENINVQEGDKMTVDNPPVSAHGLLKDDTSKIIFGMPRP